MPRIATYPPTVDDALMLKLSLLLDQKLIVKDEARESTLTWTSSRSGKKSSITIRSDYTTSAPFLTLDYQVTKRYTEEVRKYNYRVDLAQVPSNLGKGDVLYMVCPHSGKRARILYSLGNEDLFIHREAYADRLYYDDQLTSKRFRPFNRYFGVRHKHEDLCRKKYKKYAKEWYAGEPTKWAKRLNAYENELVSMGELRWW